ncbi:GIY-YIG nuclease family protein [Colwellia sp. 75C3]|uniref:GIY-YIG nuclease family protein n=1 Tax=Colwellia sp. 75C3 TaxID=888425 RepID=UPI001E63A0A4|nr:GIY-YIG nuclease family protein [Colwellia sp. 75C3]
MTHSIFSDVIKIGCTPADIVEYTKSLSAKSPGQYELFFSLPCDNPCQITKQLRKHFDAKQYINEFYEVSPEAARNALKREVMKIPVLSIH